jgi:hypothetical protein
VQWHQSDNGHLHEKRSHCDFCMMTGSIATRPEFIPTSSTLLSISDSVHLVAVICAVFSGITSRSAISTARFVNS